ncbi:MAG: hypothetical protein M1366_02205 [Patescibacteria group bacterium]|nr:hypothetical protein [Patescibacteria group bacterium]
MKNISGGKGKSIFILLLLLVALFVAVVLVRQNQELRNRAAGLSVTLSLNPSTDNLSTSKPKEFDIIATFQNGSSGEKLDGIRTVLNFPAANIFIPDSPLIDTSTSGLSPYKVDSPAVANQAGKMNITLIASTPGSGPSTDKPVIIAKVFLQGKAPITSTSVTFSDTQIVNNQSAQVPVQLESANLGVVMDNGTSCLTYPVTDTFSESSLNTDLWQEWKQNGSDSLTSGSLRLMANGGGSSESYGGVLSAKTLCATTGDFDTSVDFNQFTTSGQSEADAILSLEDQTNDSHIFIQYANKGNSAGFESKLVIKGQDQTVQDKWTPMSVTTGKLRIVRQGGVFTTYYDTGSGWIQQASFIPDSFATALNVGLFAKSWGEYPTVSANFDNFSFSQANPAPSFTPTPSLTPVPTLTLIPTPPLGSNQYLINIGDKQWLTINVGASVTPQIRFKAKVAFLQNTPDLYFKLRVKDELAFMNNPTDQGTTDSCNNTPAGDYDFWVPMRAQNGIYSPVPSIGTPPSGMNIATVSPDGWVILNNVQAGKYYSIFLKAPKTRGTLMVQHVLLAPNQDQNIQDFDWTTNAMAPGDLPDPNNGGKQDCTVNSVDLSLIEQRQGKTDQDSLNIADVNYDGVVNGNDISKVVNTLSTKPDDDK